VLTYGGTAADSRHGAARHSGRYRGSFGGAFWTAINPLPAHAHHFFVFGVVLALVSPGIRARSGFAAVFLAGMLPWLGFSERGAARRGGMLEHAILWKKLVFAVGNAARHLVVAGLVSEMFAVVLFCGSCWPCAAGCQPTCYGCPHCLIPQVLFTAGVSWFLAALGSLVARPRPRLMGSC